MCRDVLEPSSSEPVGWTPVGPTSAFATYFEKHRHLEKKLIVRDLAFERFGEPAKVLLLFERERPMLGPRRGTFALILCPIHNHDLMIVAGA